MDTKYSVVAYDAKYLNDIDKISHLMWLSYMYNPDFEEADIYCVFDSDNQLVGVGHLAKHDSWHCLEKKTQSEEFIYKLMVEIQTSDNAKNPRTISTLLLNRLIQRGQERKKMLPNRKIKLIHFATQGSHSNEEHSQDIDLYLDHGFLLERNILKMICGLEETKEIPAIDSSIEIKACDLKNPELFDAYYNSQWEIWPTGSWSRNYMRWMSGGPGWGLLCAFHNGEIISGCATWVVGDDAGITEEIFVKENYRGRGIGKAIVTAAQRTLKDKGMKTASLSCYGDNEKAINLYRKLGYKTEAVIIEMACEVN